MPAIPLSARAAQPLSTLQLRDALTHLTTTASTLSSKLLRRIPFSSHGKPATAHLQSRAVTGIIPTYYVINGPTPGTTAGIVLGSVAGFLFLVWLFYSLFGGQLFTVAGEEDVVVRRRRSHSPGHSRRSRRSTKAEVREVSRSPRRERIVVEDRRERARPRSVIVEERSRVPGDDIVEVIEEEEYRTRRGSGRRGSAYG
jgi:hypothetical protein